MNPLTLILGGELEDRLRELMPAASEEQEPRQPKAMPALISS